MGQSRFSLGGDEVVGRDCNEVHSAPLQRVADRFPVIVDVLQLHLYTQHSQWSEVAWLGGRLSWIQVLKSLSSTFLANMLKTLQYWRIVTGVTGVLLQDRC